MEQLPGELNALITLLDDTDEEVVEHVSQRLTTYGKPIIPKLENIWESAFDQVLQQRIEEIIHHIQFDHSLSRFQKWLDSEDQNLLDGAMTIALLQYPELNLREFYKQLDRIHRSIWLEVNDHLSPLEEVNAFNQIFFKMHRFSGGDIELNDPQTYYLNILMDTKKGNSYSMGILYLILAEQLDLPVYGVCLPHHFSLAYMKNPLDRRENAPHELEKDVVFYINPLSNGMIFTRNEIKEFLTKMEIRSSHHYFVPASNKLILKSLLINLKAAYEVNKVRDKADDLQKLLNMM